MRRVIWLQTHTVLWPGEETIFLSYWMYMALMMLGRQKYIQHSHWRLTRVVLRVRSYWKAKKTQITTYWSNSRRIYKRRCRPIRYEIHTLIISFWNKEELPEEWKESIIVPIYKKGDKTDCSNYRGISLSLTNYKLLSIIILLSD